MNTKLAELWRKLPERKRRVRLKRRKARQHFPRPERDAQELVQWLRMTDTRTTGQLRKRRGPRDPTVSDYVKVFSRWSEGTRQAFGAPAAHTERPVSRHHIIDVVTTLDIRTRDAYLVVRRNYPEIVPSYHQVRKFFPTWKDVFEAAAEQSSEIALGRYLALWNRLGRKPSYRECQRWKVSLAPLRPIFPSKKDLDSFIGIIDK